VTAQPFVAHGRGGEAIGHATQRARLDAIAQLREVHRKS
jgi:hypothetical protein